MSNEKRIEDLETKIVIRDQEIVKFQKMFDNYEENITNIRREYDLKLNQRDIQIKNYTGQIEKLNKSILQTQEDNVINYFYLIFILGLCSKCWK
jgi:hypothetical protein